MIKASDALRAAVDKGKENLFSGAAFVIEESVNEGRFSCELDVRAPAELMFVENLVFSLRELGYSAEAYDPIPTIKMRIVIISWESGDRDD